MPTIILALGSNLGDGPTNLTHAIAEIAAKIGTISAQSQVLETEPWGFFSEHQFVNQVLVVESSLSPQRLLKETQKIEKRLGRSQKSKNGQFEDRIIDIDLIDYDGKIVQTEELQLPHPQMHKRDFVLTPLCEIMPQWKHPVLQKTATELKANLYSL